MLSRTRLIAALLGAVVVVGAGATAGLAQDEGDNDVRPLKVNQTEGYFDGQNQVFTYAQNFHCTVEAFDDLDGLGRQGDGVPAAADPDEMILPECISGETRGGSEPTIDPTGTPVEQGPQVLGDRPAVRRQRERRSRGDRPHARAWTSSAPSRARRPRRRRAGSAAARCTPASCSSTRSSTRSARPSPASRSRTRPPGCPPCPARCRSSRPSRSRRSARACWSRCPATATSSRPRSTTRAGGRSSSCWSRTPRCGPTSTATAPPGGTSA